MHLYTFARLRAKVGCEPGVQRAVMNVLEPSRSEAGCLAIDAFRSIRDDRLFYVHSKWQDEAAFDRHAEMPHTLCFLDDVTPLIEHPVQAVRTQLLE